VYASQGFPAYQISVPGAETAWLEARLFQPGSRGGATCTASCGTYLIGVDLAKALTSTCEQHTQRMRIASILLESSVVLCHVVTSLDGITVCVCVVGTQVAMRSSTASLTYPSACLSMAHSVNTVVAVCLSTQSEATTVRCVSWSTGCVAEAQCVRFGLRLDAHADCHIATSISAQS
jgi:hypothetical protein